MAACFWKSSKKDSSLGRKRIVPAVSPNPIRVSMT